MPRWQFVTLTVNNLQAPELKETRTDRYGDIKEKDGKQTFEIEILSNHYLLNHPNRSDGVLLTDRSASDLAARDFWC